MREHGRERETLAPRPQPHSNQQIGELVETLTPGLLHRVGGGPVRELLMLDRRDTFPAALRQESHDGGSSIDPFEADAFVGGHRANLDALWQPMAAELSADERREQAGDRHVERAALGCAVAAAAPFSAIAQAADALVSDGHHLRPPARDPE